MNSRLQRFLDAENITQSQLAEKLGVAKASISHILAGRNKPGFDFIQSMAQCYPDMNLDWLIAEKEKCTRARQPLRSLKGLRNRKYQLKAEPAANYSILRSQVYSQMKRIALIISHKKSRSPLLNPPRLRQGFPRFWFSMTTGRSKRSIDGIFTKKTFLRSADFV